MISLNEQPREESVDLLFESSFADEFVEDRQMGRGSPDEDFDEMAFLEQTMAEEEAGTANDEIDGLQFGLRSLLSLMLVVGGLLELWLTRNLIFLSLALTALFILAWRRPAGMERTASLLTYGGGLGVCGGLTVSYFSSSSLAFVGLLFASLCCFVAFHGALAPLLTALGNAFAGRRQ